MRNSARGLSVDSVHCAVPPPRILPRLLAPFRARQERGIVFAVVLLKKALDFFKAGNDAFFAREAWHLTFLDERHSFPW
jgi:hypothetical protein